MPPMSPFFAGSELRGKLRGDFSEECRRDHEHTVKQLRSEKVHLLYENLWQPVILSVAVAGLLVITLWPVVPAATLLGWLGTLSLVSLLRLWLAHCYARLPKAQRQHPRWLWRFAIGTLVVGCVWGAGSFLLFTPDHYGQLAALCIVFSGIIAGGVTTLSTIWWVAACFSVPIILPLLAQFFWMGTTLSILLGTILTLFLDLDRFKLINDTLGHAAGDDLLVQVATRLQGCLRPDDQVARLSGDEFVLLALFDADADESGIETSGIEEQAAVYAARVERALGAEYRLEGQRVSVTPSIGYTCLDTRTGDHEEALKQADIAMYRAKTAGRNQVCCYRPAMREAFQQSAARYTSPEAVQGLQSVQPAFTAPLACQKALE